ncbi:MAG: PKD domain-containing protein, partial [Flavobacteriales bacterium]
LWCKTYGGNGDDRAYWSTLTKDGDMAIVGLTQSFGAGLSDLYMLKLDLNGDTLFTKTMGGAQDDWGNHIVELPWGDFAISGINASSGAGGNDMYFLLTSPLGLSGGCTEYNTGTEINNAPFVINSNAAVIDSGGQVNTPSAASVSHGAQVNVLCSQCDSAVAQFTYTDSSNTVQFSDASSGASTWFWDFGDGNNSTLQNPSHTYAADSTYFVCLIISNNCSVDTICDSVVICTLPIAVFSWMQDTVLSIQFSDSSTGANSWYWDFGDGDTSTLQNPNHIYGAEGWYLVCLYVSDGFCSDSICDSIFVSGNSVEELNGTFDLLISPNPSDGRFELLFHSRESHKFNALIYQVDGRLVDYRQLNFQNGLNSQKYFLQNLSPGMYILDLNDGVQRMRKKLIIR